MRSKYWYFKIVAVDISDNSHSRNYFLDEKFEFFLVSTKNFAAKNEN